MSATLGWVDALWLARRRTPNDRLRFWGCVLSSAIAAALLCVAAGLVALGDAPITSTIQVVADPGTRGGAAFAVLLVALPALHLTGQTWMLGSIERRDRMRQLRDAGAGRDQLRRVAVADTAIPVAVGATLGVLLLGLAISVLNTFGPPVTGYRYVRGPQGSLEISPRVATLPNVVVASWWPALLAVSVVTAGAAAAAARSVRNLDRRPRRRRSFTAYLSARVAQRTARPGLLFALRRIAEEPGPTTRPALLLGLAAVVAGASTWLRRQFVVNLTDADPWQHNYFSQSFDLVWVATWVGITLCALGLVVALTDAVVRRRRTDATAIAAGVPASTLRHALTLQALLPAAPAVLVGLATGGSLAVAFTGRSAYQFYESGPEGPQIPLPWATWAIWGIALILVATLAAVIASAALRRTTQTDQLRVPA